MSVNLINSPGRSKRKMPDTGIYKPAVLKTHLVSETQISTEIYHSHSNSLSIENGINVVGAHLPHQTSSNSMSNVYNLSHQYNPNSYVQPNLEPPMNAMYLNSHAMSATASHHAKTFSLPVSFDPNSPFMHNNPMKYHSNNSLQPPARGYNPNGDVPLPNGWSCERASTGQFYYINHITKTTTWDDPRKIYNLPTNQNEIGTDLRMQIARTVPLPAGWEEARTQTGEVYFVNHNNRTTSWEDPRLAIYMQQEQFKYQQQQHQFASLSSASNSSLSSIGSNCSSTSSSLSSLTNQSLYIHSTPTQTSKTNPKNCKLVNSLRQSLDEVASQKSQIFQKLEELSKEETLLKSKLSPQDLAGVMKRFQASEKTTTFSLSSVKSETEESLITREQPNSTTATNLNCEVNIDDAKAISSEKNRNTSNNDMDSTFVADNSATNLNTSSV